MTEACNSVSVFCFKSMYNQIEKLASAIRNDIVAGLRGYHTNLSLSIELLELDIIDERLQVIKEYSLKGILPIKELLTSINCVPVDCQDLARCRCAVEDSFGCEDELVAHFEIPQILTDYGGRAVDYIGSTDRNIPFIVYTSSRARRNHKYRKRGKTKPYVWIDTTPNKNGMNDGYIFNAPLLDTISVVAIFKDIRQLENFGCCAELSADNFSFINNEVKRRLTEKKIRYYRSYAPSNLPNDQSYQPG